MSQLFDESQQFHDEDTGELLVGGLLYIGSNGLDAKLNPITIYPDRELTGTPLSNPQTIGADGRSTNKIWVPGKYSFKVEDSANVQKYNELENGTDEQVGNTLLINALGTNDIVVNGSPTVTALVDSQTYIFTAPADNTGAMTLKIDSTAVIPLKIHHDQALASGDIKESQKVVVVYNEADNIYEVQTDLSGVTLNGVEELTNKTYTNPILNGTLAGTAIGRGALAYFTTLQSLTSGTAAAIVFASEDYDTDLIHDNSTNPSRLTVPAGVTKIRLKGKATFAANATGYRGIFFNKNGSPSYAGQPSISLQNVGAGSLVEASASSPMLEVIAGDYFELLAYQNSGGALNVSGTAFGNHTWFSMEIIQ